MNIGVVLVTFNRLDKLKIALKKYETQTFLPCFLLVVDNHSTDGTHEYLHEWENETGNFPRKVLTLSDNKGGAGGFYYGMQEAMKMQTEWIWVSDDDAFPTSNCFENIKKYYDELSKKEKGEIAALCSSVINNEKIHLGHRNHLKVSTWKIKIEESHIDEYTRPFDIDIFSYVGTMIKCSALQNAGLPEKDYFIYCDDQEHSIRVRKQGRIVVVPESKIVHNTPGFGEKKFFWGNYYQTRNDLLMRKKHFRKQFYLRWLKGYYLNVLKASTVEKKALYRAAYMDSWRGRMGIHPIYKPGWMPENSKNS